MTNHLFNVLLLAIIMHRVDKPWGYYIDYVREDNVVMKELGVDSGKRLSLQSHLLREEYWTVISGTGIATVDEENIPLHSGRAVFVGKGQKHRISNNGSELLRIAEVQLGECRENDIVRYEDDYNRAGTII